MASDEELARAKMGVWGLAGDPPTPPPKKRLRWMNTVTGQSGVGREMTEEEFAIFIGQVKRSVNTQTRADYLAGRVVYTLEDGV